MNINLDENTKISVIGDIHGHDKQFFELIEKLQNTIIVSVGDVVDKGFGKEAEYKIINKMIELEKEKKFYIVKGNHELKKLKHLQKISNLDPEMLWLSRKPLAISFCWPNGSKVTVLHAGVKPSHTWRDFESGNVDFCYIRTIDAEGNFVPLIWKNGELMPARDGIDWHDIYDGRFGYIAAGHAVQMDGIPKFYKYSCNLDTGCYATGILTAQVFDRNGLVELVQVIGPAAKPAI